jgi:hypothetical protein
VKRTCSLYECVYSIAKDRDNDLQLEKKRQEENDKLRQHFAKDANTFHALLRGIE